MKKNLLFFSLVLFSIPLSAQKDIRTFIFGNSLINHEFQSIPTPSQETSVPHWFQLLSQAGGHTYNMSGQYGFLPQHANLPPIAQWAFDLIEGAWDSDNEPFAVADFNTILITTGNFIQFQPPSENYPNENISPLSATNTIFDWCMEEEPEMKYYIYENWPDMAGFLGSGFPPAEAEWDNYNAYLNGDFHDWFLTYHDQLVADYPFACVKMIPVGPAISRVLREDLFSAIPIDNLYEDDAPHGQATIYFLAALTTYMAMYEEKAPENFTVPDIIHPNVTTNYGLVVDLIWEELENFRFSNGESRVFCTAPVSTAIIDYGVEIRVNIQPNPASRRIIINAIGGSHTADILSVDGHLVVGDIKLYKGPNEVIVKNLSAGTYLLIGKGKDGKVLYEEKILIF